MYIEDPEEGKARPKLADRYTNFRSPHPTKQQFTCKHCDREFKTQDAFLRHLKEKHDIGSPAMGDV